MIYKKLYLDKDKIYKTALISVTELSTFKKKYGAIFNPILSEKLSNQYVKIKIYDLDNQLLLQEIDTEAMMCSKECLLNLHDYWEKIKKLGGRSTTVNENFISQIDTLIEDLASFMGVDSKILDKSPESMKIVSDFFEEFSLGTWLDDDFSPAVTAYFGEVIRKKYPEVKWGMNHYYTLNEHLPYLIINNVKVYEDIFWDISKYLGGSDEGYVLPSLYDRLLATFGIIDRLLKDEK
jgi:hypothetical protein